MELPLPIHLLAHAATGILCFFIVAYKYPQKRWIAFTGAMLGAFFVDLDHVIDYGMAFGTHFNLYYFFKGFQFLKSDKIYIFFHAWEWIITLCVMYYVLSINDSLFKRINKKAKETLSIFVLALALGLTSHLLLDTWTNSTTVKSYSIIYRIQNDFKVEHLVTGEDFNKRDALKKELFSR